MAGNLREREQTTPTAAQLIERVVDTGSFSSWDDPIDITRWHEDYREQLVRAAARSDSDEAVRTGRGTINGRPVALIVNEFQFMAGSIGRAAADRIVTAIHRATSQRLPLLALTASGGTRMQEGTPAFIRMIDITSALMSHRAAGLPYLVHLGHPTTGGVLASWGSLGHITFAEPKALVGFLGPRVYESLCEHPLPPGTQVSDHLVAAGICDMLVRTEDFAAVADRAIGLITDPPRPPTLARRAAPPEGDNDTAKALALTLSSRRIGVRDVLRYGSTDFIPLGGSDGPCAMPTLTALARIDGYPCVVAGQDRSAQVHIPIGPNSLRQARRAMMLAQELNMPFVSFIDTPGAELSANAERRGIAAEIAHCIATMLKLTVPTVAVLLGQGCGGAALALIAADTVIAAENAWLAPLPPHAAATILFGDGRKALEVAASQRILARDLYAENCVSALIPEYPRDADDRVGLAQAVAAEISAHIRHVVSRPRIIGDLITRAAGHGRSPG